MNLDSKLQRTLDVIRRKRAYVFSQYLPDSTPGIRPQDIQNIVVVISASRSGSSLLYHLLSTHPHMLAPHGEEITLYKLAGLGLIAGVDDSHLIANNIPLAAAEREALAYDILRDIGYPLTQPHGKDFPVGHYLVDSVQRLLLQWPEIDFDCDALYALARKTLASHLAAGDAFDAGLYWLDLLSALISRGHPINPYFYDLPRDLVKRRHPAIKVLEEPPSAEICLEEPPFVVPQPKRVPQREVLKDKCLLLKSSSNCYRIDFMKSLYPNARFSFIYLVRNPAAAINGLMDGWLSNGFYSQSLAGVTVLNIAGYSSPKKPWSTHWWNFDSPPGWINYADQPLENVCAFQWCAANEHVIKGVESGAIGRYITVRYEDLLDQESLRQELFKAFKFIHLPPALVLDDFKTPSSIMAVNPPGPRKWVKRQAVILSALRNGKVASIASDLDYDVNAADSFV